MKPPTKCGRVHFEHRHRKWLVITVRPTTSVRKSPRKNLPSRNTPDSFCRLLHPTKSIAALRGRYFSFMVTCRGGGPSILLTQDRSVAQKPHWGFHCCATAAFCFPKNTKNPNPSPIEKRFGFSLFGASSDTAFFENHRSTIRFRGHRIATCLYRTPMGSCIEKTVAFYIPHNLKIIKYAQRSLLPSPGANGRCFFCLQRKEASVKWQFFG